MKVRNVMLNLICVSLLVTLLYSCSDTQICELGSHTSITIKIDPENMTKSLEVGDYSIDSVCSLAMPNNVNLKSATYWVSWDFACKKTKILLLYIFLGHNRNVINTKSPYPIKRLEVIRWFNRKSMAFNQSLS